VCKYVSISVLTPEAFTACDFLNVGIQPAV